MPSLRYVKGLSLSESSVGSPTVVLNPKSPSSRKSIPTIGNGGLGGGIGVGAGVGARVGDGGTVGVNVGGSGVSVKMGVSVGSGVSVGITATAVGVGKSFSY